MKPPKRRFERIPLRDVPTQEIKANARTTPEASIRTNVQKRAARPKRTIKAKDDDHPVGLWMDVEMFRKHLSNPPQVVLQNPLSSANGRYFMLAGIALRK